MKLRRGDIVLVPFPFTDLSNNKVRPAIIISADPQQSDLVLAFISSVLPANVSPFEYLLKTDDRDFSPTGLKLESVFKMRKLVTLHESQIIRYLGKATNSLQAKLDTCLAIAVGLQVKRA